MLNNLCKKQKSPHIAMKAFLELGRLSLTLFERFELVKFGEQTDAKV